jgi:transposase
MGDEPQMRSPDHQQQKLFFYVSAESRVPANHPLRPVKAMVEEALEALDGKFQKMYSSTGRPSIPPERLLKALLLQILYTIRSERSLMEHIHFNILFRWFVGLTIDEPVWDHSTFSKNRDRLIEADIAVSFLEAVLERAEEEGLLSRDHFSVDGTLLEAWASLKSFRPKDEPPPPPESPSSSGEGRNPEVDFHGEKRSNKTHASTTDPESRLAKKGKGKEAKLCYTGHILTENRNGLVVEACVTQSTGTCEREAAEEMLSETTGEHRKTVGADKGYDTKDFVEKCRQMKVTPHVAQKTKSSAIDGRTTCHAGYGVSQRKRKRIEEVFGWAKTVGCLRKLHHRGTRMVEWIFTFTVAAYNLVRMRNLGVE